MNKNIDLTVLLKDCPKGMELDCTMYENVTFVEVCKDTNTLYPIYCITTDENGNRSGCSFTKNGYASPRNSSKCVIFPKGKNTWEGFQRPFVDGDIVFYNDTIAIFKEWGDETLFRTYVAKGLNCEDLIGINTPLFGKSVRNEIRFATEEEKQILFKALEENGYKWNSKTKSLEKLIVPKFKVGDRIRKKGDYICGIIKCIDIDNFYKVEYSSGGVSFVNVKYQNDYELVPNKFNPKSLQPFDKVLVSCNDEWFCDFFSHYDDAVNKFNCTCTGGCPYDYCIPYNDDTKHLIGKTIEDAPAFYRYWEE